MNSIPVRRPSTSGPSPPSQQAGEQRPLRVVLPGTSVSPYVSRLSARASLYPELRTLLTGETVARPREEYRRRVIEENVLARGTLATRQKLWKELSPRYGLDGAESMFAAFVSEYSRSESESDRALTGYLLFALHDQLVADLGTQWLFPMLRSAPSPLRTADVLAFVESRWEQHPEVRVWSLKSRDNIASHYLSLLREFGLARGSQRKVSVRPAPGPAAVRFLLRAQLLGRVSNLAAVQSPLFRLLGLSLDEVVDLLFRLNASGALRCRIQGDVVDLDLG